jgi:ribokinase
VGRVLVIGGSNTDLVCRAPRMPMPGETLNGTTFAIYPGGKGANQAVAASRAGADVVFGGAVGDDDFGRQRLSDLRADGVDTRLAREQSQCSSGVALIIVDDRGENQIVVIPGANERIDAGFVDDVIDQSNAEILLAVVEIPVDVLGHAILRSAGRHRVILNVAPFDARVRAFIPQIDVLVCNESEASGLLGRSVSFDSALRDVEALRQLACGTAIITLGEHGACVADAGGSWVEPAPTVKVVDTTGAGDTFCGVLAAWLSNGASMRDAVRAGVVAGSLAVTRAGAQPAIPRRAEILAAMAAGSSL